MMMMTVLITSVCLARTCKRDDLEILATVERPAMQVGPIVEHFPFNPWTNLARIGEDIREQSGMQIAPWIDPLPKVLLL